LTDLALLAVMKTGIPLIDEQHRSLINLVKDFNQAVSSNTHKKVHENILNELINYVSYHFRAEEDLLLSHHYPDFHLHKKQHDELVKKVLDFQEKYISGMAGIETEIMAFLTDWVVSHINESDMEYVPHMTGKAHKAPERLSEKKTG
jgi:hemerythrin-like metal-binding protein